MVTTMSMMVYMSSRLRCMVVVVLLWLIVRCKMPLPVRWTVWQMDMQLSALELCLVELALLVSVLVTLGWLVRPGTEVMSPRPLQSMALLAFMSAMCMLLELKVARCTMLALLLCSDVCIMWYLSLSTWLVLLIAMDRQTSEEYSSMVTVVMVVTVESVTKKCWVSDGSSGVPRCPLRLWAGLRLTFPLVLARLSTSVF